MRIRLSSKPSRLGDGLEEHLAVLADPRLEGLGVPPPPLDGVVRARLQLGDVKDGGVDAVAGAARGGLGHHLKKKKKH